MAFCPKCGTPLNDRAAFCPNCGTAIVYQNVQYQQQPIYRQPYFTFTPQITYPARPKIPGRGFGITSMVLGIIAAAIAVSSLIIAIDEGDYIFDIDYNLFPFIINPAILSILSIIFGICAITVKKYKRAQAVSGLATGGSAFILLLASVIIGIID